MRSPWPSGRPRPFGSGGGGSAASLVSISASRIEGRNWKLLLLFDTPNVPPIEQANVVIRTTKGELDTGLKIAGVGTDPVNPFPIGIVDDRTILTRGESDFPAFTLQLDGIAPSLLLPSAAQAGFVLAYPHKPAQTPPADAPPAVPPMPRGPAIDYHARDYAGLRQMMMAELQALLPGWRGDAADMLTAIVEILAYAGDDLSYFQDAVGTEAYLGTARLRKSIRRHARLVDYILNEGCNARTFVAIGATGTFVLPAGTQLLTALAPPVVFETMQDLAVSSSLSGALPLYASPNATQVLLAQGSTSAALTGFVTLTPGTLLLLEEVISPATGLASDADPSHRHVVRIVSVTPPHAVSKDDPTFISPFTWSAADALPFDLWLTRTIEGNTITGISVAMGNIVLADNGRTNTGIALDPSAPSLPDGNLTWAVPLAAAGPAAFALAQDPDDARPEIVLTDAGNGSTWTPALDLLESGPLAQRFVVETESAGSVTLRFGDGVNGRMPAPGTQLVATYRQGNGLAGNIGAGALVSANTSLGVTSVWNPLPAVGGTDPEPLEHARLYAPFAFREQERAVTAADYRAITERHPDVQKANASIEPAGRNFIVTVSVDRSGAFTDQAFLDNIATYLEPYRTIGAAVVVVAPDYVPLDIVLVAFVSGGTPVNSVRTGLRNAFGLTGFFNPDNFTFGQPVYLSDIVAAALQVPGVAWVNSDAQTDPRIRFQRWREPPGGELAAGEIPMRPAEIARADSDPGSPQHGRIEFLVVADA